MFKLFGIHITIPNICQFSDHADTFELRRVEREKCIHPSQSLRATHALCNRCGGDGFVYKRVR